MSSPGERRAEFDVAIAGYGEACGECLRLAYLDRQGDEFSAAKVEKDKANQRVRVAWDAMVRAKDPETR